MKIALLTDSHSGVRNDSMIFDNESRKFFENVFFPTLQEYAITRIIHLGDIFDRRKYINFQMLKNVKEYFFDTLIERDIIMDVIVGNHDTYYKNTNEVNSLQLLLAEYYDIIKIHDKCEELTIDNIRIALVPWICDENKEESLKFIGKTKAKICMGHLELSGFEQQKGMEMEHGLDAGIFSKFDMVCSGHYHHKSTKGNVHYLGSPMEFTWSDYDDAKGFHVFDTATQELEFVRNPRELHHKVFYDETEKLPNPKQFKETIVKVVVTKKTDFKKFDSFIESLYKNEVFDVKVLEDFGTGDSDIDETVNVEDTPTLLNEYVDGLELEVDKEQLKKLMKEIYIEALHSEVS